MNINDIIKSATAHSATINTAARNLRDAMIECGVSQLSADGVTVRIREVRANSGACHDQIEMIGSGDYYHEGVAVCLQDAPSATNDIYYDYGDFSCTSIKPTREQLREFNAATPALLAQLEKLAS